VRPDHVTARVEVKESFASSERAGVEHTMASSVDG
jgi:hypothetical protein